MKKAWLFIKKYWFFVAGIFLVYFFVTKKKKTYDAKAEKYINEIKKVDRKLEKLSSRRTENDFYKNNSRSNNVAGIRAMLDKRRNESKR